jgi:hypothetical protein
VLQCSVNACGQAPHHAGVLHAGPGKPVSVATESATDSHLDGDEMAADADDGDAGHFSGTYISPRADRRAAHLRRLAIANHTHPLTSSTIPIASHGHGLHSSTQDWLVAVEVQTVPGPNRFKKAT